MSLSRSFVCKIPSRAWGHAAFLRIVVRSNATGGDGFESSLALAHTLIDAGFAAGVQSKEDPRVFAVAPSSSSLVRAKAKKTVEAVCATGVRGFGRLSATVELLEQAFPSKMLADIVRFTVARKLGTANTEAGRWYPLQENKLLVAHTHAVQQALHGRVQSATAGFIMTCGLDVAHLDLQRPAGKSKKSKSKTQDEDAHYFLCSLTPGVRKFAPFVPPPKPWMDDARSDECLLLPSLDPVRVVREAALPEFPLSKLASRAFSLDRSGGGVSSSGSSSSAVRARASKMCSERWAQSHSLDWHNSSGGWHRVVMSNEDDDSDNGGRLTRAVPREYLWEYLASPIRGRTRQHGKTILLNVRKQLQAVLKQGPFFAILDEQPLSREIKAPAFSSASKLRRPPPSSSSFADSGSSGGGGGSAGTSSPSPSALAVRCSSLGLVRCELWAKVPPPRRLARPEPEPEPATQTPQVARTPTSGIRVRKRKMSASQTAAKQKKPATKKLRTSKSKAPPKKKETKTKRRKKKKNKKSATTAAAAPPPPPPEQREEEPFEVQHCTIGGEDFLVHVATMRLYRPTGDNELVGVFSQEEGRIIPQAEIEAASNSASRNDGEAGGSGNAAVATVDPGVQRVIGLYRDPSGSVSKATCKQLKAFLASHRGKVSGRKADLVARALVILEGM